MKKLLKGLSLTVIIIVLMINSMLRHEMFGHDVSTRTLVSGMHVRLLADIIGKSRVEDAGMQIVYQLARRSIVKIEVKDSVASGIVWEINDENIIIVSNRHLLMKDIKAKVTFCNGESTECIIMGYSQQYDIGFLKVDIKAVTPNIMRDIYEAVPADYMTDEQETAEQPAAEYMDRPVLQIGADLTGNRDNFSKGTIMEIGYEPVFNTNVLKTSCYSRAGMSGGGVFDAGGRLLGMISGGEVSENAEIREAELTYSIPVTLMVKEYDALN